MQPHQFAQVSWAACVGSNDCRLLPLPSAIRSDLVVVPLVGQDSIS